MSALASTKPHEHKDPERVAAGLKAAIHNPATSPEAKASAAKRLHEMEKNPERVAAGYKATLHNAATSEEAKENARKHLREMGVEVEGDELATESVTHHEHVHTQGEEEQKQNRILGGYKATLKNPHVSEEAKEHARAVLEEHDVPV